jgi:hypothetical protein
MEPIHRYATKQHFGRDDPHDTMARPRARVGSRRVRYAQHPHIDAHPAGPNTTAPPSATAPGDETDLCELDLPFEVSLVDHIYFQNFEDPERWIDDYRLVIDHGCGISSILIHIDELNNEILAVAPPLGEYANVAVPVAAGDLIGRFTSNMDLTIADESVRIDGLIVEETYAGEPWKIHTPDPFGYFADGIRLRMEALSLRSEPPFAGAFAGDIDGKLVGNWLAEGTNG